MHLKLSIAFVLIFASIVPAKGQQNPAIFQLAKPEGWQVEKFSLPPAFAPDLPLKGTEDVRFSPDWAIKNTGGFWSYCFLWTLDQADMPTKNNLKQYLHEYYTGLVISNLRSAKRDEKYAIPVKVTLRSSGREQNDQQTYYGRAKMLKLHNPGQFDVEHTHPYPQTKR